MANTITNKKVNDEYLGMNNGLTSVFISTMCLSGVEIAKEKFEKDILIWFAQHDQAVMGRGTVGFDVSEMIWDKNIFSNQKTFIIETINGALEEKNWHLLDYNPKKEWIFESLEIFKRMISAYESKHIDKECQEEIFEFDDNIKKYKTCELHKIYTHFAGCVICNDK